MKFRFHGKAYAVRPYSVADYAIAVAYALPYIVAGGALVFALWLIYCMLYAVT